jgi:spore coat protein U-like protein
MGRIMSGPLTGYKKKALLLLAVMAFVIVSPAIGYAATGTITVTAVVLSINTCSVSTSNLNLDVGALDPENPVDINVGSSFDFSCIGNAGSPTITVTDDDGMYEAGIDLNRMRHVKEITEFIPYSLTVTPPAGPVPLGVDHSLGVIIFISGSDYKYAYAGTYEDTVVVTITP